MNFKDEYQKSFADIKADENFKQNLLAQMNMEKKRKRTIMPYVGVLSAAAAVVLVVGVGFMSGLLKSEEDSQTDGGYDFVVDNVGQSSENSVVDFEHQVVAGQDEHGSYADMNFSDLSWYGAAEDKEELLDIFVGYMTGDSLTDIYCTTGDSFTENDKMSDKDKDALAEQMGELSCTDEECSDEAKYYKAVFEDGLTIKFWIDEEGYLKLQDTGAVFQF